MIDRLLSGYGGMIRDLPDPEGYIANLMTIVCGFALEDAQAGCEHCATHCQFPPTRFELHKACEASRSRRMTTAARARRVEAQLDDRDRLEAPRPPVQSVEEVRAEMRGRGLRMLTGRPGDRPHRETPLSVQIKLGLSQEEWDAIPAARPAGEWDRLQTKHRKVERGTT